MERFERAALVSGALGGATGLMFVTRDAVIAAQCSPRTQTEFCGLGYGLLSLAALAVCVPSLLVLAGSLVLAWRQRAGRPLPSARALGVAAGAFALLAGGLYVAGGILTEHQMSVCGRTDYACMGRYERLGSPGAPLALAFGAALLLLALLLPRAKATPGAPAEGRQPTVGATLRFAAGYALVEAFGNVLLFFFGEGPILDGVHALSAAAFVAAGAMVFRGHPRGRSALVAAFALHVALLAYVMVRTSSPRGGALLFGALDLATVVGLLKEKGSAASRI